MTTRPARGVPFRFKPAFWFSSRSLRFVHPPVLTFQLVPFTLDPFKVAPQVLRLVLSILTESTLKLN